MSKKSRIFKLFLYMLLKFEIWMRIGPIIWLWNDINFSETLFMYRPGNWEHGKQTIKIVWAENKSKQNTKDIQCKFFQVV